MPKPVPLLLILAIELLVSSRAIGSPPCEIKAALPFPPVGLKSVVKGLSNPLDLLSPPDGSGRIFIVEQGGTIRVLTREQLLASPFLDIRERVAFGGEKGLLGLAFHPRFSENHRFFVNYTSASNGLHSVISEFKTGSNPNEALKESERILLTVPQPYGNHKGGDLVFGPDGFLYIGLGDGGSANDPQGNAQNLGVLLGKMLRIDVDRSQAGRPYGIPADNPFTARTGAAPEIWAYGLRNPWRYAFDPVSGLLYVADVGQDTREEIDIVQKGKNYGWNIMEGSICTPGVNPDCDRTGLEPPIYDYPRSEGTAVIGGLVYRGSSLPGLCGAYVYGDYGNGRVWALRFDGKSMTDHQLLLETHRRISSFGEDSQREIYVVDLGGEVLQIVPAKSP